MRSGLPQALNKDPRSPNFPLSLPFLGCLMVNTTKSKIENALEIAFRHGGTDKVDQVWVVDQMVRALTAERYEQWVKNRKDGPDGPDTYSWDIGIAP